MLGPGSVEAAPGGGRLLHMTEPREVWRFPRRHAERAGPVERREGTGRRRQSRLDADALKVKLDSARSSRRSNELAYDLAGASSNLTGTPSYVTRKEVIVGAVGYGYALKAKIDALGSACSTDAC